MSVKSNTVIVMLCLMPTIGVLSFVAFYRDCLREHEANVIFEQAVQLEKNDDLKGARLKYKIIDVHACTNYKLRRAAFDKAVAIQRALSKR